MERCLKNELFVSLGGIRCLEGLVGNVNELIIE